MRDERPWHERDRFWEKALPVLFHKDRLESTPAEVDKIIDLAGLKPGMKVLDLGCGVGRHALELARRGYQVTGVDITEIYLERAKKEAARENLEIEFIREDMRQFRRPGAFDAVLNLYTSFGYFENPQDDRSVAGNIFDSLAPGGILVMEMMSKEFLARNFRERSWRRIDDLIILEESQLRDSWSYVDSRWIMFKDSQREEIDLSLRLYSASEMRQLLFDRGFERVSIYGNLMGDPYDQKAARLITVAGKKEKVDKVNVYDYPEYYEIAFSWRDIGAEVDLFEECFKRFPGLPVKSVLEVGCGNSPHMLELLRRGYKYSGFDLSDKMLEYSRRKLEGTDYQADLFPANMAEFSTDEKYDFVFILLGSLFTTNTAELTRHFASVAEALKPGGLYFLDWCVQFEPPWETQGGSSWDMERDGIKVNTKVSWQSINPSRQTFRENITFRVDDHGRKLELVGEDIHRAVYPQEFLRFIELNGLFEFIGWWNNWNLDQPLENCREISRPIIVIRRR